MSRKRPPHRQKQVQQKELSDSVAIKNGQVVVSYGAKQDVEDETGKVVRCSSRRKFGAVVCGDQVTWQPTHDNEGIIAEVLPRTTLLARPDDIGRDKPIAANISRIIIVCTVKALVDETYHLHHNLIDRYIVAAESLNITPVIVLNKYDLLSESELDKLNQDMQPYRNIGYQMIYTSTKQERGLEQLTQQLQDQTSVFVGESGVGKSSIIRRLLLGDVSDHEIRVGEVSASSGKGKHTTTSTTLYHLNSGGDLIDSPGVREFGLSKIEPTMLAFNFIEFRPYTNQCKFNNCIHKSEPQCAVKQAIKDGEIDQRRYDNYLAILASIQEQVSPFQ